MSCQTGAAQQHIELVDYFSRIVAGKMPEMVIEAS